ncbi:GNAT family N-acetyltransferase [Paenibacillus donghaensis]|uniref:GNAT family N-acetyltransferase n=1 Tax=Paenibacillus donghaensis TaxID=414771 RepID=UPI001470FFAA|nr:GNAT family N-acetyltransferase [Paenibacillus donghaensis]
MTRLAELAAFIHVHNQGEQRCGYAGSTSEDIRHDLMDGLEASSRLLYEGNELVGAAIADVYEAGSGGEQDIEVWGPYAANSNVEVIRQLLKQVELLARHNKARSVHFFISEHNHQLLDELLLYRQLKSNGHYHYSLNMHKYVVSPAPLYTSIVKLSGSDREELEPLIELHRQNFQNAIFTEDDLLREVADSSSEYDIYTVQEQKTCSGYMIVRRNELTRSIQLEYICMAPEARGQGTGKALVAYLVDHYRSMRYSSMELVVSESNLDAQRFYERLAFNRDQIMKHIVISGAMDREVE